MVAATTSKVEKKDDKVPVSTKNHEAKVKTKSVDMTAPVSPTTSITPEDEVIALRARNKILSDALKAVEDSATEQLKTNFELVWFARNRNRYPNHEVSKRLDNSEQHRSEIEKLRSMDGDYHHGFHCGVLAAARMFRDHSDILHVNAHEEMDDELMSKAAKHQEKITKSRKDFPNFSVE